MFLSGRNQVAGDRSSFTSRACAASSGVGTTGLISTGSPKRRPGMRPAIAMAWAQIVGLYDVLRRVDPSPVVALNRAVALGMREGPRTGLSVIEAVLMEGGLDGYHLAHAARAEMQRRLGLAEG